MKAEFCTAMENFYDRVNSGSGAVFAAVCRGKVIDLISISYVWVIESIHLWAPFNEMLIEVASKE